jgi:predicted RNase H-like HicB family nuclease
MKGATLADAAINNTEVLYQMVEALRVENQNLKTENELLKVLLGE